MSTKVKGSKSRTASKKNKSVNLKWWYILPVIMFVTVAGYLIVRLSEASNRFAVVINPSAIISNNAPTLARTYKYKISGNNLAKARRVCTEVNNFGNKKAPIYTYSYLTLPDNSNTSIAKGGYRTDIAVRRTKKTCTEIPSIRNGVPIRNNPIIGPAELQFIISGYDTDKKVIVTKFYLE